jgi:hypothetical protein
MLPPSIPGPKAAAALKAKAAQSTADPTKDKKGAAQYLADAKKPNVHTALHFKRSMEEYGLPANVATLIGEDKHR